mgnify:CR=1 FL=1
MNQNGTQEKIKIKFSSTEQTWSHSVKAAQDPGQLECNLKTRKKNIDLAHQWGIKHMHHMGGFLKQGTAYFTLQI